MDPIHEPTSHSQVDQPSASIAQHEGDTLSDDESPLANVEPSPCGQVDEDKTKNEQQSAPLSNNLTETENAVLPVEQEPARVDNDANDAEKTPPPYDLFTTRYSSTPAEGWAFNNLEYFDKVANYLECNLYKDLKKGHVHSFLQRRDNAKTKHTHKDRQFWEKADPEIDAWMLATGNVREVFDLKSFVKRHPNIFPKFQELRKTMNVLVLESRCPVKQALHNVDKDNTDTTVASQLSSQTLWTTFRSWISK